MHIILVSNRMATARSITLTGGHLALIGAGFILLVLILSSFFSYLTVRHAAKLRLPFLTELVRSISLAEAQKTHELVRENLSTMAVRLGQMQGQLMQLDTLGERLAALAGVKAPEAKKSVIPGKPAPAGSGGPLVRPDNLSPTELQRALDELAQQIELRSQTLTQLEDRIFEERIRKHLLPTATPVAGVEARASSFGWRLDPFTGQAALHEGIDFIAEPGTPILAAAAGIVKTVEWHPQYGNLVEIDHGNELITRYAHASATFVKPGELVRRGQKIAAVGNTGRSTGPHLHFEVRINGVAQNPARFLEQGMSLARR
ncbi:MAG: peptidoglycan DD-metalloendopeptidase family protein [Rhodocyclaceae bacterium]|nr:peptidoglycan DD-metalloendopeptidase family protein [Rhodocyclaceae bacterium]